MKNDKETELIEDYKRRFPDINTIALSKKCTVVVLNTCDVGIVRLQKNEEEDVRIGILEAYLKALKIKDLRVAFITLKGDISEVKLTDKYCTVKLFGDAKGKFTFGSGGLLGTNEKMIEAYKLARRNSKEIIDKTYEEWNTFGNSATFGNRATLCLHNPTTISIGNNFGS